MNKNTNPGLMAVAVAAILMLSLAWPAAACALQTQQSSSSKPDDAKKQETAPPDKPADEVRPATPPVLPTDYVIGAEDVLDVNVWKEPDLTRKVTVRPDGMITLPVIGDMMAGGKSPRQLQDELQQKLKAYVSAPEVTVIVELVRSVKFNIVGDGIAKPGTYTLTPPMTVLDAIAMAGGLRDFAKKTKIYVLRIQPDGTSNKIPFNYKEVTKGEKLSQNIELKTRDTVVVP